MVELRSTSATSMSQSFAGDVYNSAVYLKRCFPAIQTSVVTAVGHDTLSNSMLACFEQENIGTQNAFRHPDKAPGMYLIETDSEGERSFTYWRSDAAARKVVDFLDGEFLEQVNAGDMFFFSGISLAVIEEAARDTFWTKLESYKKAGAKIVFDPNYRPRLWRNKEQAIEQFNKAFALSDIALPGVEDLTTLYNIHTAEDVIDFCQSIGIQEVVVKNGPESVFTLADGECQSHIIVPVETVVDTTSAGDAFNGVYLGSRLDGRSVEDSVKLGAKAAGTVIQHPGAIAPAKDFMLVMSKAIA